MHETYFIHKSITGRLGRYYSLTKKVAVDY